MKGIRCTSTVKRKYKDDFSQQPTANSLSRQIFFLHAKTFLLQQLSESSSTYQGTTIGLSALAFFAFSHELMAKAVVRFRTLKGTAIGLVGFSLFIF